MRPVVSYTIRYQKPLHRYEKKEPRRLVVMEVVEAEVEVALFLLLLMQLFLVLILPLLLPRNLQRRKARRGRLLVNQSRHRNRRLGKKHGVNRHSRRVSQSILSRLRFMKILSDLSQSRILKQPLM